MAIHCPYCRHEIALKGAHPGRFKPRCPQCNGKFALVIGEDGSPPIVAAMEDQKGETLAPHIMSALGLDESEKHQRPRAANADEEVEPADDEAATADAPPARASTAVSQSSATPTMPPPRRAQVTTPPPARHESKSIADSDRALSHANVDAAPSTPAVGSSDVNLSGSLGGYEIIHKLGQGGMGAVYLARQLSLDREVAVKVLHPKFAKDPDFVARFTREAYAAAHLVHHNVVQIHDIGAKDDVHYYSMEFVHGQSLGEVVTHEGKLDPEAAVGYVLQAARGLKFAHEHGMIHRDIKPDNLLLNDQGIVKVADLGLVKTPGSNETELKAKEAADAKDGKKKHAPTSAQITQANITMGTPAFMAPEQALDASRVDERADIYSLGCTLYDLVTGRPPFQGRTAVEVMTKHAREALVPPDRIVKHVPTTLSAIIMKMMGKKPDDRYRTMAEVVKAMEEFLGVESSGPFSPKEEHVKALDASVDWFNKSSLASLRSKLILAFYSLCILLIASFIWQGQLWWAGGFAGFAILTFACYQVLIGIKQRTYLFLRFRQLVFGSEITDWLTWGVGALIAILLLHLFNLHWIWLGFSIAALLTAAAFHFTIDRAVAKQRETPIDNAEAMLKSMRLRGLDEEALRQFVCKYSGNRWEEFYEALFGYEAKIQARQKWGRADRGMNRKKHGAWRDSIIAWIDEKMRKRQEEKEKRLLQAVEVKSLEAKGMSMMDARRKAKIRAERIVEHAAEVKETLALRAMETAAPSDADKQAAAMSMASFRAMLADDEAAAKEEKKARKRKLGGGNYVTRRFGGPIDWVFGPPLRAVMGLVLLAGFGIYQYSQGAHKKPIEVFQSLRGERLSAEETIKRDPSRAVVTRHTDQRSLSGTPVDIETPPELAKVTDVLLTNNAGVAGLILLFSALFRGNLLGLIVYFAAGIAVIAPTRQMPIMGVVSQQLAMIGSIVVGLLGIVFFRSRS